MPKFYLMWRMDPAKIPVDAEARVKGWLTMLEMVKQGIKTGETKDWGCAAGGDFGYSISEAPNETELFTRLLNWIPYVQFEVVPVLTVDQTIEAIKKAAATVKK